MFVNRGDKNPFAFFLDLNGKGKALEPLIPLLVIVANSKLLQTAS